MNQRRKGLGATLEAWEGPPGGGGLAPYAVTEAGSRGRLHPEPPSPTRSLYARDRDRILHSTAFRRLNYKTQVFVYHEGDHYRSRLTHSLEVAQIARSLARSLGVDEDLTEALALAHDLGHPPFGHAGERALDAAMADAGGFDHNAQSLRVVTQLEKKYASFDGLNLTWETLEGLIKHNGPLIGRVPVPETVLAYCLKQDLDLGTFASVEAQAAALADDIAYNNHDVDDGYRASCFSFAELAEVPLAGRLLAEVDRIYPRAEDPRRLYEMNRRLITSMIDDAVAETTRRLAELTPGSADDVRHAGRAMVAFSEEMQAELAALRAFLFARVYRHERVMRIMGAAEGVIADLFRRYREDLDALPPEWSGQAPAKDARAYARHVADFIAGMTDRYALAEHRRLFDATPDLR
ncbi:MAG: deoxyguanosinetriphosphate triphosphohydrolase [Methyloceanibacter sp.]|uniref:deoxyguanosinetriphosphate triphosphohydrolase n=1 Tax=Methyloceanibacter sp. TaxID=1965321 RepID=UPI003D6D9020